MSAYGTAMAASSFALDRSALLSGVAAALAVHGLWLLTMAGGESGASPHPRVEANAAVAPEPGNEQLLRQIVHDLAELRAMVAAGGVTAGGAAGGGVPVRTDASTATPGTTPLVIDENALLAALQRVRERDEQERLATLSDTELFAEAEQQLRAGTMDRVRCRRLLDVLLARPLAPALRASTLQQLGIVLRDLREYGEAAAVLRRIVDENGYRAEAGARAGCELALLAAHTKDYAAGITIADQVAREAPREHAYHARWAAAFLSAQAGDVARARTDFERLVAECQGQDGIDWIASASKRRS